MNRLRAVRPVYILAAGGVIASASGAVGPIRPGAAPLVADAAPTVLRLQVAQVAPQVSRMASRFSQLAVLGAADCLRRLAGVSEDALGAEAWLYLATGLGDVAHTDALYFGVMPPRSEMPPPARFATSGNNMAAFFVAQTAGLAARNLPLSHAELSLECAFELALSDFAAGATRSALLGAVDETTIPREFYTRRFDVGPEQFIGEGGGWFVLDAQPERNGVRALGAILDAYVIPAAPISGPVTLADHVRGASRIFAVEGSQPAPLFLLPGTGITPAEAMALEHELEDDFRPARCRHYLGWSGRFPTAAAASMVAMFVDDGMPRAEAVHCVHVNRDTDGRIGLIAFAVYPTSR